MCRSWMCWAQVYGIFGTPTTKCKKAFAPQPPFYFWLGGLSVPSCVPIFTVNSYEIHVFLTHLLSSLCVCMSQLWFCNLIMSLLFLKAVWRNGCLYSSGGNIHSRAASCQRVPNSWFFYLYLVPILVAFCFHCNLVSISVLCTEMLSQRTFCLVGLEHLMRKSCILSILVWVCLMEVIDSKNGKIIPWDAFICLYKIWKHWCCILFVSLASKWRDASTGRHVDYDQKPDVFRFVMPSWGHV